MSTGITEVLWLRRVGHRRGTNPASGLDCWQSNHAGGLFQFGGKLTTLAAVTYRAKMKRDVPHGARAVNACKNGRCVNPKHVTIEWAPVKLSPVAIENRRTTNRGQGKGKRLTRDQATEIRAAIERGEGQKTIAARYGVSVTAISKIKNGVSHSV